MNIYIYYRHASNNKTTPGRPIWFNYENCFKNLLKTIQGRDNVKLTLALDGDISQDFCNNYQNKFELFSTNYKSSLLSYRSLLSYVKTKEMNPTDLIYFLENDYLHVHNWVDKVIELYEKFSNLCYVSLYDHNDKYFYPMYSNLVSKIVTTQTHHWRTTPSTCGSFITNRKIFDEDYDIWSTASDDHTTFLHLTETRKRFVLTPIPGLNTHCVDGLSSPTINWEQLNNSI